MSLKNSRVEFQKDRIFSRWRISQGNYVHLHSYPGISRRQRREWLSESETLFVQVCALLKCPMDVGPAQIVLFPDETRYNAWLGLNCATRGYTLDGTLYTWEGAADSDRERQGILAHEMSHFCSTKWLSPYPITVLEEGLAEYIQETVVPGSGTPPSLCVAHTLRELADRNLFFDWMVKTPIRYSWRHKNAHSHAFVRFLIERHGMTYFLLLCRALGGQEGLHEGDRFDRAIQIIYNVSLEEMEREWRTSINMRQ